MLNEIAEFQVPHEIMTIASPSTGLRMEISIMSTGETKNKTLKDLLKKDYVQLDWPWHIYNADGEIELGWKAGNNSVSCNWIKKNKETRMTFKTNKQFHFRSTKEAIKVLKILFLNWGPKILARVGDECVKDNSILGGK